MVKVTKKVIWSERATNEYLFTLDYILTHWGAASAAKFETTIFGLVARISEHPSHFPLVNSKRQIRKAVATYQNSLFFREQSAQIEILTVFDTRQNPDKFKL